jgi:site-specific DNA-methyltransferase (cytosine-N4-specific)
MGEKYIDESWDFGKADTKIYTHCFHSYPAMMIPQVAGRLIDKYGSKAKLLFDPYCGTGTTLVEANLRGINAKGTDLNPLAVLIARAKTTPVSLRILDSQLKDFNDYILQIAFDIQVKSVAPPSFKNIDYWFDKRVQKELAVIKDYIEKIRDAIVANFFKVAFSETIRECSWTRKGEFKLFRMTRSQIDDFNPDVFRIMMSKLARNRKGLRQFMKDRENNAYSVVLNFNTVEGMPKGILSKESVDIIVTSPPYGDSRTTVAYGQFSRLSNQWLGFENANQIDRLLMGGQPKEQNTEFSIEILSKSIEAISEEDEKRARDVVSFYKDYKRSIDNVSETLKKDGWVCYVVGNRKVKGMTLPNDEITAALFRANRFEHVETIMRNIPSKRMPKRNSPTNEPGKLDSTMNCEYIVVMRKES